MRLLSDSPSLCFEVVDHLLVEVHADAPPNAQDWARMVTVRDANRHRIRGNLVFAPPRSSIDAEQREDVVSFLKDTGVMVAVVTDSALIRGIAMALQHLGVNVRAFATRELAAALIFLAVSPARTAHVRERIEGLQRQLAAVSQAMAPPRTSAK